MRSKQAVPAVSAASALTASVAAFPAVLTGAVAPAPPAPHVADKVVLDAQVVRTVAGPRPLVTRIVRAATRKSYTIRSGDTLSGIAGHFCGTAAKWPALFNGNRKAVTNPDMIYPGQKLTLSCDGSMTLPVMRSARQAAAQQAPTARAEARLDPFDGHHGNCGDGDGDGMDASCAAIFPRSAPAPAARHRAAAVPVAQAAVTNVSGGTLSFAGLEALWESAGGPAWAASAAATIAECESGGNQYAHNPSGASGYWQILGQVVGGNVYDPAVNAANAVSKFKASGDTFAQWVCQA